MIFLSLSHTVSSCCCFQRMLIQIAADKTVAFTRFIDTKKEKILMKRMKRAELSKLKHPPIHIQVLMDSTQCYLSPCMMCIYANV